MNLQDYDISPRTGFVPEIPLTRLSEYFSPWETVLDDIPKMVKDGSARRVIEQIPLLDYSSLSTEGEWYRALLVLAQLTHAYVWCQGENKAAKVLPQNIAIPLVGIARHLGMLPILTHFLVANCNWRKTGPNKSDIKLINTFTGTATEEGFFKTAILVELAFGKGGPQALLDGCQAVLTDDVNKLANTLGTLITVIQEMTLAFVKIHEICDPKDFYFVLRPFLAGWNDGSPLQEGLIYEGVDPKPIKLSGASAAQASPFIAIDAFLGVKHTTKSGEEHFLTKMRMYMPPKHRAFISMIENGPSVKNYVLQKNNNFLTQQFNQCLDAMQEYRNVHIRVVARYIISQANKNPSTLNEKLAKHGTGGSDLMPFLKKIRSETDKSKIQDN